MLEMLVALSELSNVECVTLNYGYHKELNRRGWWFFVREDETELFNQLATGDYDDPVMLVKMAHDKLIDGKT